jgi:hypothetical protein
MPGVKNGTTDDLSSKYPMLDAILSADRAISSRELGRQLGCSHEKANQLKKQWLETHPATPKAKPAAIALPALPSGHVLNVKEAEEYTASLPAALESHFHAIDEYLWHRQLAAGFDTKEQPIWSDVDDEELAALTRLAIRWGRHNTYVAAGVRGTVDSADYVAVGTVFAPRIRQTVEIMRKTRKPPVRRGRVPQASNENQD